MANNTKFDLNKYISFGYNSYEEYFQSNRSIEEDAYRYMKLIDSGYNLILEDIQRILDIKNNNTIQVKIMKNIDKMYINKPVKDFLYLLSGKSYKGGISPYTLETGKSLNDIKLSYPEIASFCEEINLKPSFLIKRVFMKSEDIENIIRDIFKKEIISYNEIRGERVKEILYTEISDKEIKLIMKGNLKSDKTLREELGLSNLNQLQRRLEGYQKTKKKSDKKILGYIGRFVMQNEGNRKPLVRYLFDPSISKEKKK